MRAFDRAYNTSDWAQTSTVLDRTAPDLGLALAAQPPYAYANGNTLYYGQGSGVFTLTAVATDTLSGLFSLAFPEATAGGATYGLDGVTTATQAHPYAFDSSDTISATLTITASDRAGNTTILPFHIVRDAISPTVNIQAPSAAGLSFQVAWSGQDGESGLRDYDVAYQVGESGTWTAWLTHTTQTQAPFVGEADQSHTFRVRTTD